MYVTFRHGLDVLVSELEIVIARDLLAIAHDPAHLPLWMSLSQLCLSTRPQVCK